MIVILRRRSENNRIRRYIGAFCGPGLLEVAVFLQNRLGLAALHTFNEDLAPLLRVEWIGPRQHHAATAAVLAAGRKKLSIVDCVSFQAMREHGVHMAFRIDRHFREQGFETIP